MMRKSFDAAFAVLLLGPGVVAGQSLDYGALEQLFGEPITASVTGSPQRASQVAGTMQIVTADEIRRSGARDIPGILRHVSGVNVLQTSNDHADVSVRGYNQAFSPRLLVLVDGRQVYADYYGFTPWSTIPVELGAIRQIEIVKGPNSALFGFNAVGGVINIVTYDPLLDQVSEVSASAGTQGLVQGSAVSTLKFGDTAGLRISAGHRNDDDFSTPLRQSETGTRRANGRNSINLDLGVELGDNLLLSMEAAYSDAEQPELGPIATMTYGSYTAKSIKGHLAADTSLGLIEATVYTNEITADVFVGSQPAAFLEFHNDVTVARVQSISKIATKHTLRLSAEYRYNTMGTTPIEGGEVFYDVAAIGSMWEWRLDPAVTLTSAVRWDRWSLGRDGLLPPGYGLTNEDWDRTRTAPSFNVAIVWQAADADTLRFMVGRGVQMPSLFSLGGFLFAIPPFGYSSGVPDLEETVVKNYEVSWDRALSALDAKLRVNVFHGRSRDIVAVVGGARFPEGLLSTPINIDHSDTTGIESTIRGTFRDDWRWGAGYTIQTVDDNFAAGFPVEIALVDFEHTTPRHVLDANLGWTRGPWEVDGYLRYQSEFSGVLGDETGMATGTLVPIGSYTSVDARVGYALNDNMRLALSGQNLTRSQQRQTAAPDVERQVFATFSMDF
jgi:iron complex outermembrane receptor protein